MVTFFYYAVNVNFTFLSFSAFQTCEDLTAPPEHATANSFVEIKKKKIKKKNKKKMNVLNRLFLFV